MPSARYLVVIGGRIGPAYVNALGPVDVVAVGDDTGLRIDGDQAILFGLLRRVSELNLELVSIAQEN
jgi:hypothetical protein